MQAPSGVAKFCCASFAMSPQLALATQLNGHCTCPGSGAMQLMLNCPQKSSPHIEALSQAFSHAVGPPEEDEGPGPTETEEEPGPGPTETDELGPGPVPDEPGPVLVLGP